MAQDPGIAGNLVDFSFGGNDGIITGATWAGDGLVFAGGASDHVVMPTKTLLTQSGTIIIRTKANAYGTDDTLLQEVSAGYLNWDVNSSKFRVQIFDTDFTNFTAFAGDFDWHTYALVWDTTHTAVYTDGVQAGIDPTFTGLNTGAVSYVLGADRNPADSYNGVIAYHLLYDRALSIDEIRSLLINENQLIESTPIWMFNAPAGGMNIGALMQAIRPRKTGGKQ